MTPKQNEKIEILVGQVLEAVKQVEKGELSKSALPIYILESARRLQTLKIWYLDDIFGSPLLKESTDATDDCDGM